MTRGLPILALGIRPTEVLATMEVTTAGGGPHGRPEGEPMP